MECKQCGGEMMKTKKAERNIAVQLIGVIVFFIGVALLFFVPIGTVIGAILMLASLGMGYKSIKVWKCRQCGYFFERD